MTSRHRHVLHHVHDMYYQHQKKRQHMAFAKKKTKLNQMNPLSILNTKDK